MTDILSFVTAAFSLAASTLFPALVMGVFWRRATRLGATLAMLAGLGVCGWYMVTNIGWLRALFGVTRPWAESRWFDVDPIAAGVFGVPVGFAVLVVASLLSRRSAHGDVPALVARLQLPPTAP
jgi:cation/acetate symporter